jgi:hypothetical protein
VLATLQIPAHLHPAPAAAGPEEAPGGRARGTASHN